MRAMGRRRLLKAGLAAALALSAAAVAAVRSSGYVVDGEVRAKLVALSGPEYVVVQALARRVCAADRSNGEVVTPDETDVAGFVDQYVAQMPKKMRRDLLRFLAYVEQLAPIAVGHPSRFTELAPSDQDRVLASLQASSIDLLRGGFEGVKALLFMGFYRDPRTWSILGYDGPTIERR